MKTTLLLFAILPVLCPIAATAQDLRIYPAVELEFTTRAGQFHQLESSADLAAWKPFGEPISGTDADYQLLVTTRNNDQRFYRVGHVVTTPGLVAFYKFDGNARDWTTNRNHGMISNVTLTTNRFGRANAAYYFNGNIDSFIRVPASPSLDITNAITLAAWMNFETGGILSARLINKVSYDLALTDVPAANRRPAFDIKTPGETIVFAPTPLTQVGKWHFIAGAYDGINMQLYVDGILRASAPVTGRIGINDFDVNIGRNAQTSTDNYKGIIDDVRIYNRALDAAQILELFHETD